MSRHYTITVEPNPDFNEQRYRWTVQVGHDVPGEATDGAVIAWGTNETKQYARENAHEAAALHHNHPPEKEVVDFGFSTDDNA